MCEARKEFLTALDDKISSAEALLNKPEELRTKLNKVKLILETDWTTIFSTLNEFPLTENEKTFLKLLIERLNLLEKRVTGKLELFEDFQKYIQVSLEK